MKATMSKSLTIRDVAKEAGVSVATISRYINKSSYTSEKTGNKIQAVMDRLNYKPNEIARGLAKQKSNTIALIIPDITNPFFPELVNAIEEVAKSKGYSLLLTTSNEADLQNANFWRSFQSRYVDGLILASFQFNKEVLKGMNGLKIPFVRVDRTADLATHSIGVDNYYGAQLAVQHLIGIGCKNIAHISGPASFSQSVERMKGFRGIMEKEFPDSELIIYEGDFSLEGGKKVSEVMMKNHPEVDGIFLANDLMAIGSLKALKSLNMTVPAEVAIIGFDGIKLTEMVDPELSTIEQPIYNIGISATNRLINLIENKPVDNEASDLTVRLVKRESTLGFLRR